MGCKIKGISYYLPEEIIDNKVLEKKYAKYTSEKIFKKTGISSRHVANEDEAVSDMATEAANKLFQQLDLKKEEVEYLILCTQSPDYKLPTTACIVQDKLGLQKNIGAFDMNLGCSGFVYALSIAKGLVNAKITKNVLLVMSEMYSKYIHEEDSSTRTIFGDGAAAIFVEFDEHENVGEFVFGTDGSGWDRLIVPAGGGKVKPSEETAKIKTDASGTRSLDNIYMDGGAVFNFTVDVVPKLVENVLEINQKTLEQVKLVIPHQANKYMLEYLRNEMDIEKEKYYVNLENTGNTVSATIPIAISQALEEKRIKEGDCVMLLGFGVGFSWAGVLITI